MASARHGMHAVDIRHGGNRLGPHAIVFLYHDLEYREGLRPRDIVLASYRMFWDHPEFLQLPSVLNGMAEVASGYARQGSGFDLRRVMVHGTDEEMSASASFVGVAVSTLDTAAGNWLDLRDKIGSALDVAGRAYIALVDGTKMILERGGPFGVNGTTWSSAKLEMNLSMAAYGSWKQLMRDPNDADEAVWHGLDNLLTHVYRGIRPNFASSHRTR